MYTLISKQYDSIEAALANPDKREGDLISVNGKEYALKRDGDEWSAIKIMNVNTILAEYKEGYSRLFDFLYTLSQSDKIETSEVQKFMTQESNRLKELLMS